MYQINNLLRKYIVVSVAVLAGLSLLMSACSTANLPEKVGQVSSGDLSRFSQGEEKIPWETFAQVSDRELAQERGCYDTYYFGLDIGINIVKGVPTSVTFNGSASGNFTNNSGFNQNTLTASFHSTNDQVTYYAGVAGGTGTLGKGFAQVIAVAGQNNIVIANTNININIQSLAGLSVQNALRTSGGLGFSR